MSTNQILLDVLKFDLLHTNEDQFVHSRATNYTAMLVNKSHDLCAGATSI